MSASASASFTVVYDACVLYPAALRDLLLRLALARLCRARWTEEILDEVFANLFMAHPAAERLVLSPISVVVKITGRSSEALGDGVGNAGRSSEEFPGA